MHISRREEPFRYNFAAPLQGTIQITKIDGIMVESNFGQIEIHDISFNGVKISAAYDFHFENKEIELTLQFIILSKSFLIPGTLAYQIPDNRHKYVYGVHLKTDEHIREQLVQELKAYAWQLVEQKNIMNDVPPNNDRTVSIQ